MNKKGYRHRLTITLDKQILERLDDYIDGEKIRNRSHAIEHLLRRSLGDVPVKVLILAGGRGLKLQSTDEMPKAMLPIKGKPLLEYTLLRLRDYGLTDIVVAIDYLGEKIKEHFNDGASLGVKIEYLKTDRKAKGTAVPFWEAKRLMSSRPFLVHYSDVLAEIDYSDLIRFHSSHQGSATMALTSVRDTADWGVAGLRGDKILTFSEKPGRSGENLSHLINAGVYMINPSVYSFLSKDSLSLETELFTKLAKKRELYGYAFEGKWYDVGSLEAYEKVLKVWK